MLHCWRRPRGVACSISADAASRQSSANTQGLLRMQARVSDVPDFDFMMYAEQRLAQYFKLRHAALGDGEL